MPWKHSRINALSLLGLVAILALWLVPLLPASAEPVPGDWSPAQNLSASPTRSQAATFAYNAASGDVHVVWVEGRRWQQEIVSRRQKAGSQSWGPIENLSNFEWEDEFPALYFDRQGEGHLLWTRRYAEALGASETGTDLMWRHWDGSEWSQEEVLLHVDYFLPGSYGPLMTESDGAVLLFVIWPGGYRQSEFRDGSWSEFTPWDYSLRLNLAQVLVDAEGTWHAAAFGPNNFEPWFYDAYYLRHDGTGWSHAINMSAQRGVANSIGLAFDAEDRLHFLWSDPDYLASIESLKSAIWERILVDGEWTDNAEVTLYNDDQAINGFSLTTDEQNTLHLAWSEGIMVGPEHTDLNLYYQTGDGTVWFEEQAVYSSTQLSRYPMLQVGLGNALLVWEEELAQDDAGRISDVLFSQKGFPWNPYYLYYFPLVYKTSE